MLAEILGHVSFNPATHPSEQVHHCCPPADVGFLGEQDVPPPGSPVVVEDRLGQGLLCFLGRVLAIGADSSPAQFLPPAQGMSLF